MTLRNPTSGGRLPDGRYTASDRRYVREWRAAARVVSNFLVQRDLNKPPWRPSSYDPGVTLVRGSCRLKVGHLLLRAILAAEKERRRKQK